MAQLRYDIIPQGGGWSIAMGGAVGPPYSTLEDALRDTEEVALFLRRSGDSVEIVVWKGPAPFVVERLAPALQPDDGDLRRRSARAHPRE